MRHRLWGYWAILGLVACANVGSQSTPVRPGIDVLLDDSLDLVSARRVGLLTNQTGVDRHGVADLDRLLGAHVQVSAIFAPEHGYRGVSNSENVASGVDSGTGIPIYSLYGANRAPTPAMFEGIDVLLVDLQDIGARPYTYITTTLRAMAAAARSSVPVVVLDRPDPIGGVTIQGPILDTAFASSIGMLPVPLRHGMTLGELARFGNTRLAIGAHLTVVPVAGWRRSAWYDHTGLPWIRPSPNMPDLESATDYPGTVLFEATNLSVGRGTPIAFQLIGAPWLDVPAVLRLVGDWPGVALRDTIVTPVAPPDGRYGGVAVHAVRLVVTDRAAYDPVGFAVGLLGAVAARHPDSLHVDPDRLARLAGTDRVWADLRRGRPAAAIIEGWDGPLRRFRGEREPYLLYH